MTTVNAQPIKAYWHPARNVGDALTPWLIEKITGKPVRFVGHATAEYKHMVTGSILCLANENCTVWGCGTAWRSEALNPKSNIVAVRGPLTRQRVIECGGKCDVIGDPALLLPRLYRPATAPSFAVGIAPHVIDRERVFSFYGQDPAVKLIDLRGSTERVVDAIASCKRIVSSSLHGLIIAAAYGVPARWVEFSDKVIGDGTKFRDFYLSADFPVQTPVDLHGGLPDWRQMIEIAKEAPPVEPPDMTELWESCPFR